MQKISSVCLNVKSMYNLFCGLSQRGKKYLFKHKSVVQIISLLLQFNGADNFFDKPMVLSNDMVSDNEQCEEHSSFRPLKC